MSILKLGPDDYRTMPWKNGAGSTTELVIEPPGATLAGGFHWRVSMATVAESGPFSSFPGYDRTLLLLEGQGLELEHGPHGRVLLPGQQLFQCRQLLGAAGELQLDALHGQVTGGAAQVAPGSGQRVRGMAQTGNARVIHALGNLRPWLGRKHTREGKYHQKRPAAKTCQ